MIRLDQEGQPDGNLVAEKRIDFGYNTAGLVSSITQFIDLDDTSGDEVATSTYSYDTLGRLTDLSHKNGGVDLFTPYEWSDDNLHRITQFVSANGISDYEYDKTSQLRGADHDYQTNEAYSYDANGNRTMTGYATGDNNQLLDDGTYSYTYDDEGNRLTRTNDTTDEVTEYTWDHRNRLTRVTEKDEFGVVTQVVAYTYDVFNRRIAKAVDTTSPFNLADAAIERYIYDDRNGVASIDGGNVILDFVDPDGDGATEIELLRRYLYGHAVDQLLAQENVEETISDPDRVLWPLVDHLSTVRDLIDNDGTLAAHYEYDSFGQILSGDTSLTRYLYTSREHDSATGLQYNRARWYDSAVGRWISEDPIGFAAGDTNLVRYAGNAAPNYGDPSGLVIRHIEPKEVKTDEQRQRFKDKTDRFDDLIAQLAEMEVLLAGQLAKTAIEGKAQVDIRWGPDVIPHVPGKREKLSIYVNSDTDTYLHHETNPRSVALAGIADDITALIVIGHELGHAILQLTDPTLGNETGSNVTLVENPLREALEIPIRPDYDGTLIPSIENINEKEFAKAGNLKWVLTFTEPFAHLPHIEHVPTFEIVLPSPQIQHVMTNETSFP